MNISSWDKDGGILKWILKKLGLKIWIAFVRFRIGTNIGFGEYNNEPSEPDEEILEQLISPQGELCSRNMFCELSVLDNIIYDYTVKRTFNCIQ
jgi:hypothetical protein